MRFLDVLSNTMLLEINPPSQVDFYFYLFLLVLFYCGVEAIFTFLLGFFFFLFLVEMSGTKGKWANNRLNE